MPQQEAKKGEGISPNTVLVVGALAIGGYIVYRLFGEPSGREEMLKIIEEKWPNADTYLDRITAGGREPTEEEMAIYNEMTEDIVLEEKNLPQPLIIELLDHARWYAEHWYIIPAAVAATIVAKPIAGWVSHQLLRVWWKYKCRRCQPPQCPTCGVYFATPEDLENHIRYEHEATTSLARIREAERIFVEQPTFVGGYLAVEANLYDRSYTPWDYLNPMEILNLASGASFLMVTGVGSAEIALSMRTITTLLVAI